jgi:hypothetical protein
MGTIKMGIPIYEATKVDGSHLPLRKTLYPVIKVIWTMVRTCL